MLRSLFFALTWKTTWSFLETMSRVSTIAFYLLNNIKVHSCFKQCLHKYLVFLYWQLMSALASLERFGEEYLVFLKWRSCRHCLQNEWPLVGKSSKYFFHDPKLWNFEITNTFQDWYSLCWYCQGFSKVIFCFFDQTHINLKDRSLVF